MLIVWIVFHENVHRRLLLTKPGNYQNPMIPQAQTAPLELKQNGEEIADMLHGEIYTAALSGKVQATRSH